MHSSKKRHPAGQALLAAGLLGISAVGCSEAPQEIAAKTSKQQMPYHIPVPQETVAAVAIAPNGGVRIIAIGENGRIDRPAVCDIKGPKECPFEFPEVVTTIEVGKVAYDTHAKVEPISIPGIANAVAAERKCVFVVKVGNKVYYYVEPCTP